ncbi:MAG: hypothetical protein ACU85E_14360 [Gammaproteobacteria bacterium]
MSIKSSLVKTAIKLTPDIIVIWIANIILKGIAKLSDFMFDLDTRTVYVQMTLYGEVEPIEVSLDGFAIISEGESHQFIIQHAQANRPWLNNLLSRLVGKAWKIPEVPRYKTQIELISEIFKAENPGYEQEDI